MFNLLAYGSRCCCSVRKNSQTLWEIFSKYAILSLHFHGTSAIYQWTAAYIETLILKPLILSQFSRFKNPTLLDEKKV